MTLLALPNELGIARLGLAISRKVARTAVARNRIKRAARESFRQNQQALGGLDIIILGRQGIEKQTKQMLRRELEKNWSRLSHRLCKQSSSP